MLQSDLKARMNWGSGWQLVINEFDMIGGGERKLLDDTNLRSKFMELYARRRRICENFEGHLVLPIVFANYMQ
jgi:hypothetical protein